MSLPRDSNTNQQNKKKRKRADDATQVQPVPVITPGFHLNSVMPPITLEQLAYIRQQANQWLGGQQEQKLSNSLQSFRRESTEIQLIQQRIATDLQNLNNHLMSLLLNRLESERATSEILTTKRRLEKIFFDRYLILLDSGPAVINSPTAISFMNEIQFATNARKIQEQLLENGRHEYRAVIQFDSNKLPAQTNQTILTLTENWRLQDLEKQKWEIEIQRIERTISQKIDSINMSEVNVIIDRESKKIMQEANKKITEMKKNTIQSFQANNRISSLEPLSGRLLRFLKRTGQSNTPTFSPLSPMPAQLDYCQCIVRNKINTYLAKLNDPNKPILTEEGYCHGLGVTWLRFMDWELGELFHSMYRLIADCPDEKQYKISNIIDIFRELIQFGQNPGKSSCNHIRQQDIELTLGDVNQEFNGEGNTNKELLKALFRGRLNPNTMITIQGFGKHKKTGLSSGHSVSVYSFANYSLLYCSNYVTCYPVTVRNASELVDEAWKQIAEMIELGNTPYFKIDAVKSFQKPAGLDKIVEAFYSKVQLPSFNYVSVSLPPAPTLERSLPSWQYAVNNVNGPATRSQTMGRK